MTSFFASALLLHVTVLTLTAVLRNTEFVGCGIFHVGLPCPSVSRVTFMSFMVGALVFFSKGVRGLRLFDHT